MSGEGYCDNRLLQQKCVRALFQHTIDVQFIFENGDDTVKIPANKAALAASSPVFNAMFTGGLKEKGDVKITDASPEAFQEFLQFFYDSQVKLTTKNIAEVLKLVDKYDIEDGLPVCSNFLKKNVKIDDVLWTLHLAVQFNLDDLKTFCEQIISQNHKLVFDTVNDEGGRLRVASDNRLSDMEMANIIPYLFVISKGINSKMTGMLNFWQVPLASTEKAATSVVKDSESMQFSLDEPMMLTDIIFSRVYRQIVPDYKVAHLSYKLTSCSFDMYIEEKSNSNSRDTKTLRMQRVVIDPNRNKWSQVELQPPIPIQPSYIYTIRLASTTKLRNIVTYKAFIPEQIAPNVSITILPKYQSRSHSLIYQLRFKQDQDE